MVTYAKLSEVGMSNDMYTAVIVWALANGTEAQNSHLIRVDGGDGQTAAALGPAIGTYLADRVNAWRLIMGNDSSLASIVIYKWDGATETQTPFHTHIVNASGAETQPSLPGGLACKLNLFVSERARPAGIYLPPVSKGYSGLLGAVHSDAVVAALLVGVELTTTGTLPFLGLAVTPFYWSLKDGALVNLVGASVQVDDTFDYIRSRKKGVGI